MKIDTHLTWGLLLIAVGWVCIAVLLKGCGDWDPDFFCVGSAYEEAPASATAAIVGGEVSTDRRSTVRVNGCSGVAIDSYTVLTVAHCVLAGDNIIVVDDVYSTTVVDHYVHRAYVGPPFYDIAVLRTESELPGPFPFDIYDPAAGGYEPDLRYYCTGLVAQGYGLGSDGKLSELDYLVGRVNWLTLDGEATYGADERAPCSGDSGAPVYAIVLNRDTGEPEVWLAGLISTGNLAGCYGDTTSVFLENFSPWIREVRRCLAGGEDRLWDFYVGSFRGTTCEELRL